jgi:hypothetical protein
MESDSPEKISILKEIEYGKITPKGLERKVNNPLLLQHQIIKENSYNTEGNLKIMPLEKILIPQNTIKKLNKQLIKNKSSLGLEQKAQSKLLDNNGKLITSKKPRLGGNAPQMVGSKLKPKPANNEAKKKRIKRKEKSKSGELSVNSELEDSELKDDGRKIYCPEDEHDLIHMIKKKLMNTQFRQHKDYLQNLEDKMEEAHSTFNSQKHRYTAKESKLSLPLLLPLLHRHQSSHRSFDKYTHNPNIKKPTHNSVLRNQRSIRNEQNTNNNNLTITHSKPNTRLVNSKTQRAISIQKQSYFQSKPTIPESAMLLNQPNLHHNKDYFQKMNQNLVSATGTARVSFNLNPGNSVRVRQLVNKNLQNKQNTNPNLSNSGNSTVVLRSETLKKERKFPSRSVERAKLKFLSSKSVEKNRYPSSNNLDKVKGFANKTIGFTRRKGVGLEETKISSTRDFKNICDNIEDAFL